MTPRHAAFAGLARRAILAALLLVARTPLVHADGINVSVANGQGIALYSAFVQLDRDAPIHRYQSWILTGHVDLGIAEFQGNHGSHAKTRAFGGIGKLRWEQASSPFFVEFGLGMAGFSNTLLGGERKVGGRFTFVEVLRSGLRFGAHKQYEIAIFAEHCSNAGLFRVNEGSTSPGVSFLWYFR